jgi:glycosyltransferase involved in cell wall biosynthesis
VKRVDAWRPDAVHITGWPWFSHFQALRAFGKRRIPVLFRGDSHLLDRQGGWRWPIKWLVLRWLYSNVSAFLVVGSANRRYYESFAVSPDRLFPCPHSIDVGRFAEPADEYEREARDWRDRLGILPDSLVLLFAGKFERKKRPVELMRAVQSLGRSDICLVMVGGGELEQQIKSLAAADQDRFRVLPFQNQTRMPVVYRLGDIFVLPSAYGETWGLAVNEAMASMRPVLVSDRVGCAADLVDESCGWVYSSDEPGSLERTLNAMSSKRDALPTMGKAASRRSHTADISCTEAAMLACLNRVIA